jgi:hypothetical protein
MHVRTAAVSGLDGDIPRSHAPLVVDVTVTNDRERSAGLYLGVSQGTATPIFLVQRPVHFEPGSTGFTCQIPHLPLPRGRYYLWVGVFDKRGREFLAWQPATHFDVFGAGLDPAPVGVLRLAPVAVAAEWDMSRS